MEMRKIVCDEVVELVVEMMQRIQPYSQNHRACNDWDSKERHSCDEDVLNDGLST